VTTGSTRRVPWVLFRSNDKADWTFLGIKSNSTNIIREALGVRELLHIPEDNSGVKGLIITTHEDTSVATEISIRTEGFYTLELSAVEEANADAETNLADKIEIDGQPVDEEVATKLNDKSANKLKITFRKSDPTFILVRKSGQPSVHVLYIGTSSYVGKNDFNWPTDNEWMAIRTPDGEEVEIHSPHDRGPELQIRKDIRSFLSPIRLLENTKYSWAILAGTPGEPISKSKSPDDSDTLTWGSTGQKLEHEGKSLGTFNFKNFLGTAIINSNGSSLVQVESTSLKIGYEDEYLRMLKDLTEEALDHILNHSSITSAHLKAGAPSNKENAFGKFVLLKAVLPLDRLKSSCAVIRSKPHTTLSSSYRWLPASAANGRYAMQAPASRIRWAINHDSNPGQRQLKPAEVLEDKRLESTDTPPNQFAKFALRQFVKTCESIYENPARYGERHAGDAMRYAEECRRQLRLPPFKECTDMRAIPFDSQVLQKRSGYRDFFRGWITSNLGLSIKELSSQGLLSPEAQNRDAPKLYELWLISHLKKALKQIADDKDPIYEATPYEEEGQIELFKKTSDPLYVVRTKDNLHIALYYNRTFGAKGKDGVKQPSYSVELKPDYTVEIVQSQHSKDEPVEDLKSFLHLRNQETSRPEFGGSTTYIHFDAKFRINNVRDLSEDDPTKAKPGDIYKMHTYNEAIYGTITSIILYPGNNPADYRKFTDLVPGVSALAIKPDKDADHNDREADAVLSLKERILKILEEVPPPLDDKKVEESKLPHDYNRMRFAEKEGLRKARRQS
jgi:predicted component of viral defense system (DUF524 family)